MNIKNLKVAARRFQNTRLTQNLNDPALISSVKDYAEKINYKPESRTVAIGVCIANGLRESKKELSSSRRLMMSSIAAKVTVDMIDERVTSVVLHVMKLSVNERFELTGDELDTMVGYVNQYIDARNKEYARPNLMRAVMGKVK